MAITNDDEEEESESESDEVNSNSNHFDFQDELQKLHFNLEKLGSKNIPLKKKISCLLNEDLKILRRQKSLLKRKMRS